jgi:putative membrane protein
MRNASLLTLLAIFTLVPAWAVEDPRETADPGGFAEKATQEGMMEVTLGEMAQQKAKSDEVKAFGAQMVKDHGAANASLAAIARRKKLKVPVELDGEHRAIVQSLAAKTGPEFDASYASEMAAAHAKAVTLFIQAAQGQDGDVAAFASRTLPTLRAHKQMAESLKKALGRDSAAPATDRRE